MEGERIIWVSFHMEGKPALQTLLEKGHNVEAIVTHPPEDREARSGSVAYDEIAQAYDVSFYEVEDINADDSIALLEKLEPDVLFVIGWSQILSDEALSIPEIGVIGAHASLLPRNRGRAPVNWAILQGQEKTGNTLMWLSPEVDQGDIIDQREIPLTDYDTCRTVYEKVAETNREMILKHLQAILQGEAVGRPQSETDQPPLPGRSPEDGLIDWGKDSGEIYNLIRAVTRPYPGAFTYLDGERWFIWEAALLPDAIRQSSGGDGDPGTILGPVVSPEEEACGLAVACGKGVLVILEAESESGRHLHGRELSEQDWEGTVFTDE